MRQRGRGYGRRASAARRILYTARMATAPKPDPANYRLSVRDFGPIVEADVDFRPLTVFVGPSNTGKSYMAVLAYALHQVLQERDTFLDQLQDFRQYVDRNFRYILEMEMSESDVTRFFQWAKRGQKRDQIVEWDGAEGIIRNAIEHYFSGSGSEMLDQIKRCLGIESISLIDRKGATHSASIQIAEDGISLDIEGHDIGLPVLSIPHLPQIEARDDWWRYMAQFMKEEHGVTAAKFGVRETVRLILPHLFDALSRPSYYLPSGRSGIMHAHRTVASALFQNAQYAGIRSNEKIILLSGISVDFLQHLLTIEPSQRLQFRDTASFIEKHILKGAIRNVPTEAGYPDFRYHPTGWKDDLPLMNASSMVSEIAPVVLFLRHIVERDAVLIIDEPEAHLHPEMQVEFTRVLAGAVKAGLRVILTTHSEWVVETIGNLVELSKVPKARRDGLPGGAYALPPEDVGVWLFRQKKRPRGSVVEEVRHDPETGVYGVGYDDVAIALHNEWASAAPEKLDS